jgi:menaquinone C8-methyltransferase
MTMKSPQSWISAVAAGLVGLAGRRFTALEEPSSDDDYPGYSGGRRPALYVHLPFCRRPCPFCAFHRFAFEESAARDHFAALTREIKELLGRGFVFPEVYIGGGTPTVLPEELLKLLALLRRRLPGTRLSVETHPEDLTPGLVDGLTELGVERLSVGVQSFDAGLLRLLGRPEPTPPELKRILARLRGRFPTLQLDLLYNHPAQTPALLAADIAIADALGLAQVTFNPLMPPLVRGGEGVEPLRPDPRRGDRLYEVILERAAASGRRPSTVWCFVSEPGLTDEYLVANPEYLAAGCGAVGFYASRFYANSFSLAEYFRRVERGGVGLARRRSLRPWEREAYLLLGFLFGMGGTAESLEAHLGGPPSRRLRAALAAARSLGLVRGARLTPRGMPVINRMMQRFFGALTVLRTRALRAGW